MTAPPLPSAGSTGATFLPDAPVARRPPDRVDSDAATRLVTSSPYAPPETEGVFSSTVELDALPEGPATPLPERPEAGWRRRLPWDFLARAVAWIAAIALLGAAAALSWWLIAPQLGKPYVYDEAAFAFAGHAVAETGIPLSNVGHMQTETPGDFSKRFNWALWHPPLYVFTLGYAFREWGETEQTARLVGVACNALAALFAFGAGTIALWGRTRAAPLYAAAGAAVYVTNPFVIQSALLLDIDGTVLVASVALLLLLYTALLRLPSSLRSRWVWLLMGATAFAFGVSLWAKMTTAWALPVAAAIYRVFATRPWRPLRLLIELPLIPTAGGALFIGTWWLACTLTGMPFLLPFQILDHELRDAAGSTSSWRENPRLLLDLVSYVALWVSPYLIFLFVWSGLARLT
ncbi:MAG TPA: hypothetical protein VNM48_16030, partial [Chloroflexota bacterium]|nr:hypothetical protein [Chloroflexota bacterium]